MTFEASLAELNKIVDNMQNGDLALEQSLALFERGVTLTRQCQQALQDAEQKVKILMEKNQTGLLADFTTDEN